MLANARSELARPATYMCAGCRCSCHDSPKPAALGAELLYLTVTERHVFDALFEELGDWIDRDVILRSVWGFTERAERHTLRVYTCRMRVKLAEHGAPWRIETAIGALRLVEVSDTDATG